MTVYVEAYYADGSQKLGNLDGQYSFLGVKDYRRTAFYKNLKAGKIPAMNTVACWKIVDDKGTVFETIPNPKHAKD